MPSPFPVTAPYVEGELWQEFHDRLANQVGERRFSLIPHRPGIIEPIVELIGPLPKEMSFLLRTSVHLLEIEWQAY